jgi:hypothetical protein
VWKIVAFIKHSDKLPAEVESGWRSMAATPGGIREHAAEHLEQTSVGPATR